MVCCRVIDEISFEWAKDICINSRIEADTHRPIGIGGYKILSYKILNGESHKVVRVRIEYVDELGERARHKNQDSLYYTNTRVATRRYDICGGNSSREFSERKYP